MDAVYVMYGPEDHAFTASRAARISLIHAVYPSKLAPVNIDTCSAVKRIAGILSRVAWRGGGHLRYG